jgi:hypothetical protein
MYGSKPKLHVLQKPKLSYFIYDPVKQDLLKQSANCVQLTNGLMR